MFTNILNIPLWFSTGATTEKIWCNYLIYNELEQLSLLELVHGYFPVIQEGFRRKPHMETFWYRHARSQGAPKTQPETFVLSSAFHALCPFPFQGHQGLCWGWCDLFLSNSSGDAWGMDGSRTKAFHSLITPIPRTCPQAPSPGGKTCWIFMFLFTEVFCFGHMVRSGVKRKLTFSYWTECPCFYLRTGSCLGLSSLEKRSCSRHRD